MAKYKISSDAEADLIRIHHFGIRKFGMNQADRYFNDFLDCFETIAKQPFAFESIDHIKEGYRRCPCGSDQVYYRINNDVVEIMAIIGRQDLSSKL